MAISFSITSRYKSKLKLYSDRASLTLKDVMMQNII